MKTLSMMTTENGHVSNYRFPSVELLEKRNDGKEKISIAEIAENENRLKQALEQLGIKIARIETIIGTAITRYEVTLLPGYKFSKIKRLEAELALPLGVLRVRIAEIDPFRPAIIIEIPNTNRGTVSMYSLIQSKTFRENKAELPLAIGQTVENAPFILDLTEISHLLIAGATGQGKTVALHAMITSLFYSKHPGELKFVMIDPKRIEFTPYGKIERHFLAKMESEEAIITDPYKAVDMLNILCLEMDNRLELKKEAGVRNIVEYNEKFTSQRLDSRHGHRYLPYIVVVIDEFADLIMSVRKIENLVARLAQIGHAAGIHLIIATQRPNGKVITGLIKANFPAYIAFRVVSRIDSRTIIDSPGAEQLIGSGDMLVSVAGKITRVQGALIDPSETERIVQFISEQNV